MDLAHLRHCKYGRHLYSFRRISILGGSTVRRFGRSIILGCCSLFMGVSVQRMPGEGVEVSGKILIRTLMQPAGKKHKDAPSLANVVVWLSPLKPTGITPVLPAQQPLYRLVQN